MWPSQRKIEKTVASLHSLKVCSTRGSLYFFWGKSWRSGCGPFFTRVEWPVISTLLSTRYPDLLLPIALLRKAVGKTLTDFWSAIPSSRDQSALRWRAKLRRTLRLLNFLGINESCDSFTLIILEVPRYPGPEGRGTRRKTGRVRLNSHTSRIDALADSNETEATHSSSLFWRKRGCS